jgi:hypothetical protein
MIPLKARSRETKFVDPTTRELFALGLTLASRLVALAFIPKTVELIRIGIEKWPWHH